MKYDISQLFSTCCNYESNCIKPSYDNLFIIIHADMKILHVTVTSDKITIDQLRYLSVSRKLIT